MTRRCATRSSTRCSRELPSGPASCVLRHYNSELIRALQQRGFAVYGTQLLLISELGEKVRIKAPSRRKKPVLIHAGIARSVAVTLDRRSRSVSCQRPQRGERDRRPDDALRILMGRGAQPALRSAPSPHRRPPRNVSRRDAAISSRWCSTSAASRRRDSPTARRSSTRRTSATPRSTTSPSTSGCSATTTARASSARCTASARSATATGTIVGLTCRVGRAVTGTIDIIKDMVISGQSILLLGPPGIGKTTMLRECARVLSDECGKRVVIVDTSNEIAGDGDIPHPGIGRSRRMQVRTPALQHAVMIEAVENHMPQCIVIDEIGTELEAVAARTIAERGVQLVGTAHGSNIDSLLVNPTLNDLLGGIQTVTLSDEEARRRGTQKSVLERKSPPTFDVLIEIQERDRVVVHAPLAETVDEALRGRVRPPQLRTARRDGRDRQPDRHELRPRRARRHSSRRPSRAARAARGGLASAAAASTSTSTSPDSSDASASGSRLAPTVRPGPPLVDLSVRRLTQLPRAVAARDAPAGAHPAPRRRRRPRAHVEELLPAPRLRRFAPRSRRASRFTCCAATRWRRSRARSRVSTASKRPGRDTEPAMQDVLEGIEQMQRTGDDVELTPQNAYVRRLQHQLVEQPRSSPRAAPVTNPTADLSYCDPRNEPFGRGARRRGSSDRHERMAWLLHLVRRA